MEAVTLNSGRQVQIRPIRQDDGLRLKAAYAALSPRSKYQRFLAPKPYLTETDTNYLVNVDGVNHVALVATTSEPQEAIVGVARLVRLREDPDSAEFAITIGDTYQGDGLGTAMLEQLADEAVERGITHFHATMLAENVAIHKLVQRLAGRQAHERHLGIVDEVEVELAA
jgi:RimJ/RimL family protein N-acetyltransferase